MFPHSTILGPVFWIAMGLIYALTIVGARYWVEDLKIKMNWWKWLMVTFWYIFFSVTIAGAFTLLGENEAHAARYFLGLFGVLSLISGVGLWRYLISSKD